MNGNEDRKTQPEPRHTMRMEASQERPAREAQENDPKAEERRQERLAHEREEAKAKRESQMEPKREEQPGTPGNPLPETAAERKAREAKEGTETGLGARETNERRTGGPVATPGNPSTALRGELGAPGSPRSTGGTGGTSGR